MKKILLLILTVFCLLPPGQAQVRLGLHVSQGELDIWRQRALGATATDYKVFGDVQTNSPGDWTRILANANNFKNNATLRNADRFVPTGGTGCYPLVTANLSVVSKQGGLLKDAAFVYLVKEDASYLALVKSEILAYARNPLLNFANRSKWCFVGGNHAGFITSEVLNRILFAYDYVRIGGGFTSPEQEEIQAWFYQAAKWLADNESTYNNGKFVNRNVANPVITSTAIATNANPLNPQTPLYHGGPLAGWFTDGYNNRILTCMRFVAMVAVMNNDAGLKMSARRSFREYIRYGVFPGGDLADMCRWRAPGSYEGPETGINYCFGMAMDLCEIADVFARDGEDSLYTYSTEAGAFGTASPGNPKSLLQVVQNLQKYMNGTHTRYGYGSATSSSTYLINGVEPHLGASGAVAFDTWFAMSNLYWNNAGVENNFLRITSGNIPYPASPRGTGSNQGWSGQAAIYPGILFMFGQTDASPYPTTHQNQALTVNSPGAKVWGDAPFALTATASSGLTPTIVVTGPGTYLAGLITITGTGTINITVSQAGNGSYNPAAVVTRSVIVNKAQPSIAWITLPDANIADAPITFTPSSSAGLTVTTVSNNSVLLNIGGNTYSLQSVGLASVTASTAATSNYLAASATRTFNVISTPVEGSTDLMAGKSTTYPKTLVVINDSTRYTLFQAVTNLAGTFGITRYADRFKEVPRDLEVFFLVGGTWIKKIDLEDNTSLSIDTQITGVSAATQIKVTAIGFNIQLKEEPFDRHLFGQ